MESIYQYVMQELQRTKGNWSEVARGSGVSKRTVEKIARREIADPGVSHVERLARYFRGEPLPRGRSARHSAHVRL